jgi:hypothetical protein
MPNGRSQGGAVCARLSRLEGMVTVVLLGGRLRGVPSRIPGDRRLPEAFVMSEILKALKNR